jgi:hypothetical protein
MKMGTLAIVKAGSSRPAECADYLWGKQYTKVLILLELLEGRQVD